ncbi:MAG TPA: hypothetical protein VGY54_23880 [Polyangiaceae bacterium]|nr:hypothetical protein [Polyangiaceae bacterium]
MEPAETVTADERRKALEAMAFESASGQRSLDPMALGAIGLAAVDPVGRRFSGEATTLVGLIAERSLDFPFATRVLSDAAIEVWSSAKDGTVASRTALLRAVGAFLLHHEATAAVLGARVRVTADESNS